MSQRDFFNKVWKEQVSLELPSWLSTDPWALRRQSLIGTFNDKKVLDLGCGTGMWSVFFALKGAFVNAIDISLEGVILTAKRAKTYKVNERLLSMIADAH